MITIKPHHFMDIIKLYGSGIEEFIPDEKMGHDFYKDANRIIQNSNEILLLTIDAYDLCAILYQHKEYIFNVWEEEAAAITKRRYELFCLGAKEYLKK